jgi:GNAT superfamily N-acetyltransferase
MSDVFITAAVLDDVPLLHAMICELAEYERLRHAVTATADDLQRALFGPHPCCEAIVARRGDGAVGFALFFTNYSTFVGRPGLYLEDLYVRPAARGAGVGTLLFRHLARLAVERGCGRMEWAALNWNEPAIRFYTNLGAERLDDWRLFRLAGNALGRVARDDG